MVLRHSHEDQLNVLLLRHVISDFALDIDMAGSVAA